MPRTTWNVWVPSVCPLPCVSLPRWWPASCSGTAKSMNGESAITEGKVAGDDITFVENLNFQDMPLKITYKGKISGDEIKFTRKVGDFATTEIVAKREKEKADKEKASSGDAK